MDGLFLDRNKSNAQDVGEIWKCIASASVIIKSNELLIYYTQFQRRQLQNRVSLKGLLTALVMTQGTTSMWLLGGDDCS